MRILFGQLLSVLFGISLLGLMQPLIAGSPLQNLEVFRQLYIGPVSESVQKELKTGQALCIQKNAATDALNWLQFELQKISLSKDIRVLESPDSNSAKLVLEHFYPKVEYIPLKKWFGLKTKAYRRSVSGELKIKFVSENAVRFIHTFTPTYSDTISNSEIEDVETAGYSFSVGTKQESKFLKRLLEPGLIAGTTATVVYLFYSLRSD